MSANANTRLEAFSDGVFAIALTLLIIEIKPPAPNTISTTSDLWHALDHLKFPIFAFVLSFGIILITWVNHHATLKLIPRSSAAFIYANGFLLLTVVFIPFPTALLGEFVGTDHAAPAVVLYNSALVLQACAWMILLSTALTNQLATDERFVVTLRDNRRHAYFAFAFYGILAVAAFWFPTPVAIVTTLSWIFWATLGIRMKQA